MSAGGYVPWYERCDREGCHTRAEHVVYDVGGGEFGMQSCARHWPELRRLLRDVGGHVGDCACCGTA